MKISKLAIAASFVFAATASQASVATSFASASLANFHYELIDLTPTDGFASSISFDLYSTGNGTRLWDESAQQSQGGPGTVLTGDAIVSTARTLSTANTGATGTTVAGNGLYKLLDSSASVSGYANGAPSTTAGANGYDSTSFLTSFLSSFTLSKNTAVIFSANASASASVNNLVPVNDENFDYANASASLEVRGNGQYAESGKYSFADYVNSGVVDSGRIGVAFFNFGNEATQGKLRAAATVQGSIAVTPVPEPESYAMLLAGLGLVGAITRRRKAQQHA